MSSLMCPKCQLGIEKWISDPDADDLLEKGIMACENCGHKLIGIGGYIASCKAHKIKRENGYRQDKRIRRRWKRFIKMIKRRGQP